MRRAQDQARSAKSRKNGARIGLSSNLQAAREARDENVPAKRADFFKFFCVNGFIYVLITIFINHKKFIFVGYFLI